MKHPTQITADELTRWLREQSMSLEMQSMNNSVAREFGGLASQVEHALVVYSWQHAAINPDAQPEPQIDSSVLDALRAYEKARGEMFAQCLSNGLFDAWGKPVDCTLLNAAHQLGHAALSRLTP